MRMTDGGGELWGGSGGAMRSRDLLSAEQATLEQRLRPCESRVLRLLGDGKSNAQIAQELGLSQNTVKGYVGLVLLKMGFRRRVDAVFYTHDAGML